MEQDRQNDGQNEMAMVKFSLIAPTINNTYPQVSKRAYYADVSQRPVALPDGSVRFFNANTLATWESRYRRFGFEGLLPKQRSDSGSVRKLTEEQKETIADIKAKFPKMNCVEIRNKLVSCGVLDADGASLSTIQRYVRAHFAKGAQNANCKDRKAFEEEFSNGMWQADTLYGPYVSAGNKHTQRSFLQMIIDDKSRMIVGGRFWTADNAVNFQNTLKEAVGTYGIPDKLYVDNGAPYRNDALAGICGRIGCVLIHTPVRDGASKGKVERNFRTLRNRLLNCLDPAKTLTLDELNSLLSEYIVQHNATLHSAHDALPVDVWAADALARAPKMPPSPEWLTEAFRNHTKRRVRKDATIVLEKLSFDVPMDLIGEQIEVAYTPKDPDDAWVIEDAGRTRKLALTDKVANSRVKRKNPYSVKYGMGM